MSEKSIAMKMAPLVSTNTGLCLESKWQKSLTATPHRTELLVLSITNAVHYVMLKGSLSNYDDDHNDDFKKTIGLMIKTTALHVHHAF